MDSNVPILIAIGAQTLGLCAAILVNNSRLTDLRKTVDDQFDQLRREINARFDHQAQLFDAKLTRVEQVIDARLSHLEQRQS